MLAWFLLCVVFAIVASIAALTLRGLGSLPTVFFPAAFSRLWTAGGEGVRPAALTRAVASPDAPSIAHLLRTHEWEDASQAPELAWMSAHAHHDYYPGCALCTGDDEAIASVIADVFGFLGAAAPKPPAAAEDEVRPAGAATPCVLPLGVPPRDWVQIVDLLRLVAGDRCGKVHGGSRCWQDPYLSPNCPWSADRWCANCTVQVVLDLLEGPAVREDSRPVDLLGAAGSPCGVGAEDGARPGGGADGVSLAPLPPGVLHPEDDDQVAS